jgi:hypothetical protein
VKAVFAGVLLIAAAAAPAPEIRYFKLQRPVSLPQNATGQACVVLDPQLFSHASPALADLRLYRGSEETPYVIHTSWQRPQAQSTITPINRGVRAGKTVFDAAMPGAEYADVQLNLTGQNFLASVTVSGSHDVAAPQTRIGTYTVFDFSSQHLGRSTILHLPRSNFRSLHFEITGPIAPDQITGIAAFAAPPSEPKYLTVVTAGPFARKGKTSVASFTLPSNVPVDRILFSPSALPSNFSRDVAIQAEEVASEEKVSTTSPSFVGSGSLLRIHRVQDGRKIDEELLALTTLGTAFPYPTQWTVTIENGDDLPVGFSKVEVQMRERNLCFESAAGGDYVLYYGDKALSAPRYDYAAWFALQANATPATLGAEQTNPKSQDRPDERPFTEKHPVLLWAALILVILLLGAVALRTARRVGPPANS